MPGTNMFFAADPEARATAEEFVTAVGLEPTFVGDANATTTVDGLLPLWFALVQQNGGNRRVAPPHHPRRLTTERAGFHAPVAASSPAWPRPDPDLPAGQLQLDPPDAKHVAVLYAGWRVRAAVERRCRSPSLGR